MEAAFTLQSLQSEYADCLDADALERWPEFFAADGRYRITTAENERNGHPMSILLADNQAMMRDRVAALREANVYAQQCYRHVLSPPAGIDLGDGELRAATSFVVVRTTDGAEQLLFAAGVYRDRVRLDDGGAKFLEKTVVLDSRRIDTLLAIPL